MSWRGPPFPTPIFLSTFGQLQELFRHNGGVEVGIVDLVGTDAAEDLSSVDINRDLVTRVRLRMGSGVVGARNRGADQAEVKAAAAEGAEATSRDQRLELPNRRAATGGRSEVGLEGAVALQAMVLPVLLEVGTGKWLPEIHWGKETIPGRGIRGKGDEFDAEEDREIEESQEKWHGKRGLFRFGAEKRWLLSSIWEIGGGIELGSVRV